MQIRIRSSTEYMDGTQVLRIIRSEKREGGRSDRTLPSQSPAVIVVIVTFEGISFTVYYISSNRQNDNNNTRLPVRHHSAVVIVLIDRCQHA